MKIVHQFLVTIVICTIISCKKDIPSINETFTNNNVEAGFATSYILKDDNTLWVSGSNNDGQFGNSTYIGSLTFIKVADDVIQVSGGYGHTFIIKKDKTLWVSGNNLNGELGLGDSVNSKINTFTKAADSVISISCSNDFSFIIKSDFSLCHSAPKRPISIREGARSRSFKNLAISNVSATDIGFFTNSFAY